MKRVIIESPYAGNIARNTAYARLCLFDSINSRGEAPICSHLLFPQILREDFPPDRQRGIRAGIEWMAQAEVIAFYRDFGVSPGMVAAMCEAQKVGATIEHRWLGAEYLYDNLRWRWWHRWLPPRRFNLNPTSEAGRREQVETPRGKFLDRFGKDDPRFISYTLDEWKPPAPPPTDL